ncbi:MULTISPECIES: phosphonate ABC transporter ATP-binding protein [unclassified Rhizobium]|uniref:phosphonate ABC transporter ATP-binding protein n=1 Tax=unclassified Rhizobium TaxID=2613769 RepID=UPI000645DF94|nr:MULTISPECIES: phosphonate ABC transporter ATP-binding protein [unclassified Rhizobium]MBN8954223.1 phosphonate ABC transporter ATP-binding protein [Rhizobium tropici]OJY70887.1 MAG: phosphonate ABC transporter ATP-binding protein [Rhizobium sp. 60-20]RKD50757.1 phosphonate transport system ATP-binding protein [Rhizobium sp. WW_1]
MADLVIRGLCKNFGDKRAVDSVDLSVPQGQMIGVIGRSGAGKSTLLRMINRLTEPTIGDVLFGNRNISTLKGAALREWRAECGMIFQQFNLVGRLDVLTNVLLGRASQRGVLPLLFKHFGVRERVLAVQALDRLDIAHAWNQRADSLSGGQQQRVAIARTLLQEPKLVLADEPIASLDPKSAAIVMDALKSINREDGITVLCNLHTIDTARRYCDRVIGMANGRIVFDGPAAALDRAALRLIYAGGEEHDVSEAVTSVDIEAASG